MRELHFTTTAKTKKDLLFMINACYANLMRRGMTHAQFVEDVSKYDHGTDPDVVDTLGWWEKNCVCGTRMGAKVWSNLSNHEGLTCRDKMEETTWLKRRS
jgi:hypothetical protein